MIDLLFGRYFYEDSYSFVSKPLVFFMDYMIQVPSSTWAPLIHKFIITIIQGHNYFLIGLLLADTSARILIAIDQSC